MISGKSYSAFMVAGLDVLCALVRLAYFNVMEEERQEQETGSRKWYLGLPVTTIALLCLLYTSNVQRRGYAGKTVTGMEKSAAGSHVCKSIWTNGNHV